MWGQVLVYCWFWLILIVIRLVPYRQEGLALPLNWSELRISELRTNQTQPRTELRYSNRSWTDFGRFTIFWTPQLCWLDFPNWNKVKFGLVRPDSSPVWPPLLYFSPSDFCSYFIEQLNVYMQLLTFCKHYYFKMNVHFAKSFTRNMFEWYYFICLWLNIVYNLVLFMSRYLPFISVKIYFIVTW